MRFTMILNIERALCVRELALAIYAFKSSLLIPKWGRYKMMELLPTNSETEETMTCIALQDFFREKIDDCCSSLIELLFRMLRRDEPSFVGRWRQIDSPFEKSPE